MIVGGNDIVIPAPPDVPVTDLILSRVRRLWPNGRFQGADEDVDHALGDIYVVMQGGRSREFFIYRDRPSFEAWERDGATPTNLETMLYFLIGDPPADGWGLRQVTLVCGERTGAILNLIGDLESSFRASQISRQAA